MSNTATQPISSPLRWWGLRLPLYNLALIIAGPVAFICYLLAIDLFRPDLANDPEFDPGGVAIILQAFGYGFAMVLANLCYLTLGPGLESFIKPANPIPYRRFLFVLGTAFSVALPFGIPVLVAVGA